jgi:hypothetical protein
MPPPVIESEVDFSPEGAGKPCKTVRELLSFSTFPLPTRIELFYPLEADV